MQVSLIIATYNWPKALELSIKSALDQSVKPDEIIIADDGSKEETLALINRLKEKSTVPIIHVWHDDKGFRLSAIRNKAMAKAKYEYIIQIDGDIILHHDFIKDHKEQAEEGYFMRGSRVRLDKEISLKKIANNDYHIRHKELFPRMCSNSLRIKVLRYLLAKRYAKKVDHLRGCNMAFWKKDIILVNGYNEDFEGWGHEDGEIAYRLYNAGIMPKSLKFGGVVYHIWHNEAAKENEHNHVSLRENVKENKIKWCNNGINKYL